MENKETLAEKREFSKSEKREAMVAICFILFILYLGGMGLIYAFS